MKKVKIFLTALITLIQLISFCSSVKATNIDEIKRLERGDKGYYCVQKWDGSKWVYLTYNKTFYNDVNGIKYIAYCLSPGIPGVGYVAGEKSTYEVKVKEILNNDIVWRIIKNGYPYKTLEEIGVETSDDAYFATMQSINCVLRGYTLEETKQLYSPGKFAINGQDFKEIQRRGSKTLNAMYKLIDIGYNGTEKRTDLLDISINSISEFSKEENGFYSKTFSVESLAEISEFTINNIDNFPIGTFVSDLEGNEKQIFKDGEKFKIMIPENKILEDINGKIVVKAKQKNYPIYYSNSMIPGYQDYALCNDEYSEVYATTDVYVCSNKSKLIIKKVDSITKQPIEGVKFQIVNSQGVISNYITNKDGKIILANQNQGTINVKEIETVEKYKIIDKDIKVELGFDEVKEIEIENEMKKGNIKITKVDKDNDNIKLENVKFQLINENEEIIRQGETDANGELLFENITVGKYKICETEAKQGYIVSSEKIKVELQNEETINVVVENEKEKIKEINEEQEISKNNEEKEETKEKEVIQQIEKKELPKTGGEIIEYNYITNIIITVVFSITMIVNTIIEKRKK